MPGCRHPSYENSFIVYRRVELYELEQMKQTRIYPANLKSSRKSYMVNLGWIVPAVLEKISRGHAPAISFTDTALQSFPSSQFHQ